MRVCNVRVNWEGKLKGRHKDRLDKKIPQRVMPLGDFEGGWGWLEPE